MKLDNVYYSTYGIYEHRDWDMEIINSIKPFIKNRKLKTDFNSLVKIANIMEEDYCLSVQIGTDGNIIFYNGEY